MFARTVVGNGASMNIATVVVESVAGKLSSRIVDGRIVMTIVIAHPIATMDAMV